ncbi:transcription repressor NadR [Pseudogracilibacillus sp. ICA-222130]|uniref:transcription repressor NadR n=1 Tax=Pseudogracilibacillus sp. ICA-222130 TaxID=3134655 RepID=UPI0030BAE199
MSEKMSGEKRRTFIVNQLKRTKKAYTGRQLAEMTNVSRQVIVTDIALLRTADEPIIATNRGYMYLQENEQETFKKVVACQHRPEDTADELNIIVDNGVKVLNVIVEHPIYGEMTGSLQIESRFDVKRFIEALQEEQSTLLSVLTDGIHLHTLEADTEEKLEVAIHALRHAGYLYEA